MFNELELQEILQKARNIGVVERLGGSTTVGGKEFANKDGYRIEFYNKESQKYRIFTKSHFIKMYTGRSIEDIFTSDAEIGKAYRIMNRINKDNMVMYQSSSKTARRPAGRREMIKILNLSEDRGLRLLSKMSKAGFIKELKKENKEMFFVNPVYTMNDKGISLTLWNLFREEIIEAGIPEQAVEDLDFLNFLDCNEEILELAVEQEKAQFERELENDSTIKLTSKMASKSVEQMEEGWAEKFLREHDQRENANILKIFANVYKAEYIGPEVGITREFVEEAKEILVDLGIKPDPEEFNAKLGHVMIMQNNTEEFAISS